MQYKQWLYEWLENYVKISSKARTVERYGQIIKRHPVPKLGEYDLNELTPMILQKYIAELLKCGNINTGRGLASNSVNSIINVIQNSMRTAYNLGYIAANISDKITRPKMAEKQIECFTVPEQRKIENEILSGKKKDRFLGVIICLYTGLRIGELLALEWSDIDISAGLMTVRKSCHDGKRADGTFGRITDTPKTASSERIIPLPKQLCVLLKEAKKKSMCQYVVAVKGREVPVRNYQRNFSNLLEKLNIPHRGFHSLRHTFATRALECGMDVRTLSEILGHKNPTVTLNRYAHSMFDHKKQMMNVVGKFLNF